MPTNFQISTKIHASRDAVIRLQPRTLRSERSWIILGEASAALRSLSPHKVSPCFNSSVSQLSHRLTLKHVVSQMVEGLDREEFLRDTNLPTHGYTLPKLCSKVVSFACVVF